MQQMMHNFNQMSLQTGNGVNPLVQAQMMNELKYRRLYEEERNRNENLERKMSSLIDRIERHTENNMKIKAKYSKEIEHLRYQVNMLERENEDLRLSRERGGQDLQRELEAAQAQRGDLDSKLQMLQNELDMARTGLEEARRNQGNPDRERQLEAQLEAMKAQLQRNEEEVRIAKGIAEEERQKGGRERNEMEVEKHKMELNVEHWRGQTEQLQREIQGLRDMLDYEKKAKMRLEDRIRDLESRSFGGGWNNDRANFGQGRGGADPNRDGGRPNARDANRNMGPVNDFASRQDQNKNHFNQFGGFRNPSPKKEDVVFGKPTFPARNQSPGMGRNRRGSSPFATDQKMSRYGGPGNMGSHMGGDARSNMGDRFGRGGMDSMSSRGNGRNGPSGGGFGGGGARNDDRWGASRGWNNPGKQEEETGALDSIASKRMAVRRGRGEDGHTATNRSHSVHQEQQPPDSAKPIRDAAAGDATGPQGCQVSTGKPDHSDEARKGDFGKRVFQAEQAGNQEKGRFAAEGRSRGRVEGR